MKKLILISALLLFGSNSWADVSMIPLNDYLKQQKMK